jgi:hypothetical protein
MLLDNEDRALARPSGPDESMSVRRLEEEVVEVDLCKEEVDLDDRAKHDAGGVL